MSKTKQQGHRSREGDVLVMLRFGTVGLRGREPGNLRYEALTILLILQLPFQGSPAKVVTRSHGEASGSRPPATWAIEVLSVLASSQVSPAQP